MEKVSTNFNRSEFACSCGCGFDAVDVDLLAVLEDVRDHFGTPVHINSACRCESHNKSIGGADNSMHKKAKASDIVVSDANPAEVYYYLDRHPVYGDKLGLGKYSTFTHIDVRGYKARWQG